MILIVDDRPENIFSLQKILESAALEVDTATSGEEALRKVLKTPYELIILDVQMPDMDGYEVAAHVKGTVRGRDIPILFLSAVATDKRFITRGLNAGAMDYLTKPVDPDILLLKVKNFCLLSRQRRELIAAQEELKAEVAARKAAQEGLEMKVAERTQELEKLARSLEASNEELQQFASVASHDLQEPLRKILIFIGLIKDHIPGTGEVGNYFGRIENAAERMQLLIRDLLAFSNVSLTHLLESVALGEMLADAEQTLEMAISEKGAIIEAGELHTIDAVPGAMRQLFLNLLSNALKFTRGDATPHIIVRGEHIEDKHTESKPHSEGEWYRLTFEDNGIGFEDQYAERIFAIFQRLHQNGEYAGTGIGLAITRKIVEKHGGIIAANSAPGQGAIFTVVLPVKQKT